MQELASERGITITRTIKAPRERVYEAFLYAGTIGRWFGPDGFHTQTHTMEPRAGGRWKFTMTGPDGRVFPNWVKYLELTPPERIVWDHGEKADGPAWFRMTLSFVEVPEGTHVTLEQEHPTRADRDRAVKENGAVEGGKQTLARLAAFIEGGVA